MLSRDDIAAARANVAVYAQHTKLTRHGDWLIGRCPLHDDRQPSFGVRGGLWKCFAGCGYGDTIDFLQQLKHCGFDEAVRDLAGRANGCPVPPPSRLATRAAGSNSKNSNKDSLVQKIWDTADQPGIAELYLSSRGIRVRPKPLPEAIRGHKGVWCAESRSTRPCVVAAICAGPKLVAIQRIWTELSYLVGAPKGSRCADLKAGKKTLGNCEDGAVRLFEPGPQLGLAEGIEDAIAVYQLYRIPCWACIGASRMANVWIPDEAKELIVFADRDEAGRMAAQRTAEAQRGKRSVSVMFPPVGRKDFVEMLA